MVQKERQIIDEWTPPGVPSHAKYNPQRDTSTLFFEDGVYGEFYLRGGICWPIPDHKGPQTQVQGFAVLLGLDTFAQKAYVLEERSFVCIDHVVSNRGHVEFEGLSIWFNHCWQKYHASKFYYNQDVKSHKKYNLQIIRSPMIKPVPTFIKVHWPSKEDGLHVFYEWGSLGRWEGVEGTELHDAIRDIQSRPGIEMPAGMQALLCALHGYDRYPFRPRPPKIPNVRTQQRW